MESARMLNFCCIVELGGDQRQERQQSKSGHAVANQAQAPCHAFASLKNKSLAKMANIFLRIAG